jgi:hypothetical protein
LNDYKILLGGTCHAMVATKCAIKYMASIIVKSAMHVRKQQLIGNHIVI